MREKFWDLVYLVLFLKSQSKLETMLTILLKRFRPQGWSPLCSDGSAASTSLIIRINSPATLATKSVKEKYIIVKGFFYVIGIRLLWFDK